MKSGWSNSPGNARADRSNAPSVIYVEDQCEDDPRKERFNYFAYIAPIIESCGFTVIHARDHRVLPDIIAKHPEAVAILSDIDTHKSGAGLEWAMECCPAEIIKQRPLIFMSNMPYHNMSGGHYQHLREMADAMQTRGASFLQKPFFESLNDLTKPQEHEDEAAFKQDLCKWLGLLKVILAEKFGNKVKEGASPVPHVTGWSVG